MSPFHKPFYLQIKAFALALAPIEFKPTILAIVLAALIAVAFIAWVIWLIVSKRLPKWAAAASQSRKWNAQDNKLSNELKNLARAMNQQHAQLGKETWDARLSDPGYDTAYTRLVNLNQQVLGMEMHVSSLKEELKKITQDRDAIETQYDDQLNKFEAERRTTQTSIAELSKRHKGLDTELTELSMEKARIQREIKETRTKMIEIDNSDAPNKPAFTFPLTSKLEQLSTTLMDVSKKSPSIDDEIMKVESELKPLNDQLEELNKNFSRTQILKNQELSPLDNHIAKLKQSLKKKEEEILQLEKVVPTMLEELGAQVDYVRPESLHLAPLYTNLDDIHERTRLATDEQQQLRLLMDKGDKSSARKFSWFLFAILLVIVAILSVLIFVK